jgi:hypothetical protein
MGALLTGSFLMTTGAAEPTPLKFAGLEWTVKHGPAMGPGPNTWDRRNVWVDDQGRLHLQIARRDGKWTCAELSTTQRLHDISSAPMPLHLNLWLFQGRAPTDEKEVEVVIESFRFRPLDPAKKS